jgi:DNA-binding MarR family transcriptional regulator
VIRDFRLANQAWEAYFRAQATIAREFTEADIWEDLATREYAVLHALSTEPNGLRMTELGADVLLTQAGMSRLIDRLEARGLVVRSDDETDARAWRIRLTPQGTEIHRRVGSNFAKIIAQTMTRNLNTKQLEALRDISLALLDGASGPAADVQKKAIERITS